MTQTILGVDIGLDGGISNGDVHLPIPTLKIETKSPVYIYNLDSKGKKQFYKSGPVKGQPKRITKSPGKYKRVIDTKKLFTYFNEADVIVVEDQGTTFGNSARSTRTTSVNYGKLLACAELSGAEVVIVQAQVWKKALKLSKDKLESVEMAEKLTGDSFRTPKGALLDGMAEGLLIHHWYITNKQE